MNDKKDQKPNQHEDVVAEILSVLPMSQNELQRQFEAFLSLDPDEIYRIAQKHSKTKYLKGMKYQYKTDGVKPVKHVLDELDKLKNSLGGSSAFIGRAPSLPDNSKFFFGIPMPAVQDWFRMTLKKGWRPKFFWEGLSKLFGVSKNEKISQYEEIHLRIQRFGLLLANRETFVRILDKKDEAHYSDLAKVTGMAWHPTKNGVGVEKVYMDFTQQFLTEYFQDAKKRGKDALIEYFKAFEGVCFEDRVRTLEAYTKQYPLSNKDTTEVTNVADWGADSKAEDVFMKETVLLYGQLGEPPTPSELFEHLNTKKIFEMEFKKDDDTKAKPTKEQFDKWAEEQIDMCILSEEKNPAPAPSLKG